MCPYYSRTTLVLENFRKLFPCFLSDNFVLIQKTLVILKVLADKRYDSQEFIDSLAKKACETVISSRSNSKNQFG